MTNKWAKRFELIRGFGFMALFAVLLLLAALFTSGAYRHWLLIFGVLFFLPAFLYTYVVVIWHWKERYSGKHSDLWGALILIETSGWFKLVYVFRHIVPDMRGRGRYRKYL